jgi:hypothetical protein
MLNFATGERQPRSGKRRTTMSSQENRTAQFGELVVAAFDGAADYSTDPLEVSRLATEAVAHILRRTRSASISPLPPPICTKARNLSQ